MLICSYLIATVFWLTRNMKNVLVKKIGNDFEVQGEPTWFWREIFTPELIVNRGGSDHVLLSIPNVSWFSNQSKQSFLEIKSKKVSM